MSFASVAALLDTLRQHSLLEPEQRTEAARLAEGSFRDPRALAGELVRRGWLTPYQVNQLFQGRAKQLVLGSFVLLERIGEGGMGQVFKARHRKLGRLVALKVIRKERLDNPDAVRRFRREIQTAAQLSHANVVLALDADECDGAHFFVMEYVEGIDLARYVKQKGPLPIAQACDLIRQAALGLQHAHERGMVHRDIKPHNLLLVPQTGTVKVLDMGLARLRSEGSDERSSTSLTEEGAVMGTPDYIAPEQARDARSADIRADLYSLGCTLHFLLTGRVPFPGGTVMEKLIRHQSEEPRPLRELRPDVPPAVANVVHRLMAKRPDERFQTPAELLAALVSITQVKAVPVGENVPTVVEELPVAPPSRVRPRLDETDTTPFADLRSGTVRMNPEMRTAPRRIERKRRLLLGAVGGVALFVLLPLLAWLFRHKAKDTAPDDVATSGGAESGASEADAEWKALRTRGESVGVDRAQLREELLSFRRKYPGTSAAGDAGAWLMRLPAPLDRLKAAPLSPLQKLDGQPKEVLWMIGDHRSWVGTTRPCLQYSPDGRRLACNARDGTIRLLEPGDLTVREILKAEEEQIAFDFRRDGKMLIACGRSSVVFWNLSQVKPQQTRVLKGFADSIANLALSPTGNTLAITCHGEARATIHLWRIDGEPKEWAVLKGHTGAVCKPAFSPDGKTLATASQDKTIRIWDVSGAQPQQRALLANHAYWVVSVAFSPDGKLLASSGQHDFTVRFWDMTQREPKEITTAHFDEATNQIVFSPDGKRLACGFWAGHWRLYDVVQRQLQQIAIVPDHVGIVLSVALAPDGRMVATAADDGTIHVWLVNENPPRQIFDRSGHGQRVDALVFAPDERTLISLSADGTGRLWDLGESPPRPRAVLPLQLGYVYGALRPDGRTLVTGDSNPKRVFWDVASGKELRSSPGRIWRTAFSPDGKVLATNETEFRIKFRDAESGDAIRQEQLDEVAVSSLAFSPNGHNLAVGDLKGTIRILHVRNPQSRILCRAPAEGALTLAFRPDGKILAAGGKDGRVRLYDAVTGRERSAFPGHESSVSFLAYSPDGRQLCSTGQDGQIILRDGSDGKISQTLHVPLPITAAAWTVDERHLAVGLIDGTIYLLRLAALKP